MALSPGADGRLDTAHVNVIRGRAVCRQSTGRAPTAITVKAVAINVFAGEYHFIPGPF